MMICVEKMTVKTVENVLEFQQRKDGGIKFGKQNSESQSGDKNAGRKYGTNKEGEGY